MVVFYYGASDVRGSTYPHGYGRLFGYGEGSGAGNPYRKDVGNGVGSGDGKGNTRHSCFCYGRGAPARGFSLHDL
jgi:hypothetical protein